MIQIGTHCADAGDHRGEILPQPARAQVPFLGISAVHLQPEDERLALVEDVPTTPSGRKGSAGRFSPAGVPVPGDTACRCLSKAAYALVLSL